MSAAAAPPVAAQPADGRKAALAALAQEYAVDFGEWARASPAEAQALSFGPKEVAAHLGEPDVTFDEFGVPVHIAFHGAPLRLHSDSSDAETRAREALSRVAGLWDGAQRPPDNLRLLRITISDSPLRRMPPMTHVTFVQEVDGTPLYDGRITVHLTSDGDLRRINGRYLSDVTVAADDFFATTRDLQRSLEDSFGFAVDVHDVLLHVWSDVARPSSGSYVYRVEFVVQGHETVALMDAVSAEVRNAWERYPGVKRIRVNGCLNDDCSIVSWIYSNDNGVETCTGGTYPVCNWSGDTLPLATNANDVWNMFKYKWNHDQNVAEGSTWIDFYAGWTDPNADCRGPDNGLKFCPDYPTEQDVVGHEFAHRVVDTYLPDWDASLFSGSLEEGYADAFAEILQEYKTLTSNWCQEGPDSAEPDQPYWLCRSPYGKEHPEHLNEYNDPLGTEAADKYKMAGLFNTIAFLLAQDDADATPGRACNGKYDRCDPATVTEHNIHYGVGVSSLQASSSTGKYIFGDVLLDAVKGSYYTTPTNFYHFRDGLLAAAEDGYGAAEEWSQIRNALRATGFYEKKTNYGDLDKIGLTSDTPAVTTFSGACDDRLAVVFKDSASNAIKFTEYDSIDDYWEYDLGAVLNGVTTDVGPAVAYYNGRLHMVYKEVGQTYLRHVAISNYNQCVSSGTFYPQRIEVDAGCGYSVRSNYSPALTVFNGKLYLAYTYTTGYVRYIAYDDTNGWAGCATTTNRTSSDHPAIAATQGGKLWFVYKGAANQNVYYLSMNTSGTLGSTQAVPMQNDFQSAGESAELIQTDRAPAAFAWNNRLYVAYYSPSNAAVRVVSCGGSCDDAHRGAVDQVDFPNMDWMYVTELPAWTSRTPALATCASDDLLYLLFRSATDNDIWITRKGSNY